jgi:hypothetical protein
MKLKALFFLILCSLMGYSQAIKKKGHYTKVKTILVDINGDGKIDTIVLSSSLNIQNYFNKISISLSGFDKKVFYAKDSWTEVDKYFFATNKSLITSNLLFIKRADKHTVVLLFGETVGSGSRVEFSILNIENNAIKMVFDHTDDDIDVEVPIKLTDIEDNGRLCFVYTTLQEIVSSTSIGFLNKKNKGEMADIGSYAPYWVYPVNDSCRLDTPLSIMYNKKHYVYAGLKYNDKIRILYPRNGGKPSIWKH